MAVDFGVSSFLPVSFFRTALFLTGDQFTHLIASLVRSPELTDSRQLNGLLMARYTLVMYGNNSIGEHISFFSFLFLASRSLTGGLSSMHCTGLPAALKGRIRNYY